MEELYRAIRPCHNASSVHIDSSAPTRIDLAGGTLDIWPLYLFHEGSQTLNAAISLRASVTVSGRDDGRIAIESTDTGSRLEAAHWSELAHSRELPLARLASFFRPRRHAVTHSESPRGGHRRLIGAQRRGVRGAVTLDRTHGPRPKNCSRSR
jgi:D-glycero-alpha-D-manno-heptose-7-phosphate kinase